MENYETIVAADLEKWQAEMMRNPSLVNRLSKKVQDKFNSYIPEKIHKAITATIKQMLRLVLFGAEFTTARKSPGGSLELREAIIKERINFYKKTAAAEGGVTGAGGILLGIADFPLLIGIKIKLLFDIASIYGVDVTDYRERVYILYIFQLAFSTHETRKEVYLHLANWEEHKKHLPDDIHLFNWRKLQQEYRDYLDIAKMAQLIPVIGAPIGAVVNYRLITKLGKTAMNAYRLRLLPSTAGLKYVEQKEVQGRLPQSDNRL